MHTPNEAAEGNAAGAAAGDARQDGQGRPRDGRAFFGSIAFHLETMPRSGTHFLINSLRAASQCGYATVFGGETVHLNVASDWEQVGDVTFSLPRADTYCLKSYFFQPAQASPLFADDCTVVRQMGFFLDGFYSWGHLLARQQGAAPPTKYEGYRVTGGSREWAALRSFFPVFTGWLDRLDHAQVLRYEDYGQKPTPMMTALAERCSCPAWKLFQGFRPDERRIYYLGDRARRAVRERFDREVYETMVREFGPHFSRFYPEAELGAW